MKIGEKEHYAHPWRVHTLAADFELIDVWRFDVSLEARGGFDAFLGMYADAIHAVERSPLSRMRYAIGRVMGWDAAPSTLPIPGCTEHMVAERLDEADKVRNRFVVGEPSLLPLAAVRPVYKFEDEALWEVSNDTVHALMHVSCVVGGSPELAVYIKSRGLFTRLYMAAIWPARHAIIYPSMVSLVERRWLARPLVA